MCPCGGGTTKGKMAREGCYISVCRRVTHVRALPSACESEANADGCHASLLPRVRRGYQVSGDYFTLLATSEHTGRDSLW